MNNRYTSNTTLIPPVVRISVVIPTFNRQATIGRAIESVLAQTCPADEIIVVDDGSTDDTEALMKKWPGIVRLKQDNQGVSAARNLGIRQASGDWIALLDSDDEWLPSKLEKQRLAINNNPEARLCHCDELWIRNGKRVNPMKKHAKAGGNIYLNCLPLCAISPSAALIHTKLFETVGLFDTRLPACEDYDFWLRVCASHPVLYIDEPLLKKYGGHTDQLSRKYPAMDRFRLQAMEKILRSGQLDSEQHQATLDELERKLRVFTLGAQKRGKHHEVEAIRDRLGDLLHTIDNPAETA